MDSVKEAMRSAVLVVIGLLAGIAVFGALLKWFIFVMNWVFGVQP